MHFKCLLCIYLFIASIIQNPLKRTRKAPEGLTWKKLSQNPKTWICAYNGYKQTINRGRLNSYFETSLNSLSEMLIQILPCDVSSIFHILTIIKNVLQILLCGMSKTFENCLRSLKHFLRSHYSIGNSNVSVLVLIDSICLKSMELFLENQGSVTLHMSRRMLTGQDSVQMERNDLLVSQYQRAIAGRILGWMIIPFILSFSIWNTIFTRGSLKFEFLIVAQ